MAFEEFTGALRFRRDADPRPMLRLRSGSQGKGRPRRWDFVLNRSLHAKAHDPVHGPAPMYSVFLDRELHMLAIAFGAKKRFALPKRRESPLWAVRAAAERAGYVMAGASFVGEWSVADSWWRFDIGTLAPTPVKPEGAEEPRDPAHVGTGSTVPPDEPEKRVEKFSGATGEPELIGKAENVTPGADPDEREPWELVLEGFDPTKADKSRKTEVLTALRDSGKFTCTEASRLTGIPAGSISFFLKWSERPEAATPPIDRGPDAIDVTGMSSERKARLVDSMVEQGLGQAEILRRTGIPKGSWGHLRTKMILLERRAAKANAKAAGPNGGAESIAADEPIPAPVTRRPGPLPLCSRNMKPVGASPMQGVEVVDIVGCIKLLGDGLKPIEVADEQGMDLESVQRVLARYGDEIAFYAGRTTDAGAVAYIDWIISEFNRHGDLPRVRKGTP